MPFASARIQHPGSDTPVGAWSVEGLRRLFLAPSSFFRNARLDTSPGLLIAIWISGLEGAIDRVDQQAIRSDFDAEGRRRALLEWLAGSWGKYWIAVAIASALFAPLTWLIGGWWYRKRLEWSGADTPDPRKARLVFIFARLVYALPAVIFAIGQTVTFPDYATAWEANSSWASLLLILLAWSVVVSYRGARSSFDLRPSRAILWFLVLPCFLSRTGRGSRRPVRRLPRLSRPR